MSHSQINLFCLNRFLQECLSLKKTLDMHNCLTVTQCKHEDFYFISVAVFINKHKKKKTPQSSFMDAFVQSPPVPPQRFLTAKFRDGPMLFEPITIIQCSFQSTPIYKTLHFKLHQCIPHNFSNMFYPQQSSLFTAKIPLQ